MTKHRTLRITVASVSSKYDSMTVNERLHDAGLTSEFDTAIDSGDRSAAIALLMKVAMSESSAAGTVDAVLANPTRYGYPRGS